MDGEQSGIVLDARLDQANGVLAGGDRRFGGGHDDDGLIVFFHKLIVHGFLSFLRMADSQIFAQLADPVEFAPVLLQNAAMDLIP
ncbi:hypothetical protein D3C76_1580690 [compost metagenome]